MAGENSESFTNFMNMNLEEATLLVNKYRHLKGSSYKGKEISAIIPFPTDSGGLAKIIEGIERQLSLDGINSLYKDFDVIALMDLDDYYLTGVLVFHPLRVILNDIQGQT